MLKVILVIGAGLILAISLTIIISKNAKKRGNKSSTNTAPQTSAARINAAKQFAVNVKAFIGLYEPLSMIKEGTLKNGEAVFADWGARIEYMDDMFDFKNYWNDTYAGYDSWDNKTQVLKAGELIDFAIEAGVVRSEENEVTMDREVLKYYDLIEGIRIEPGATLVVIKPYWAFESVILEKGQVNIK